MKEKDESKFRGVPANVIILPLEIIMAVLLILIFVLGVEVSRSSNKLANLLQRSGIYQQEVWNLQSGINTLAETTTNYIQRPVAEDGSPSVGPLKAYAQELNRDRRASQIAERFRSYGINVS